MFAGFTLGVCASAVLGIALFRFMPLFAVLTALVLYQLLSGWHVIYTKADGPNRIDALLCAGAAVWAITLMPLLFRNTGGTQGTPVVIYATLGALFVLIGYDLLRWLFPRTWHAKLWRYEHIYKIIASMYAMLSAAAGNFFPHAQPWSQLVPSALGIASIAWFFWKESHGKKIVFA